MKEPRTILARNVRIGDRVMTTNGMREIVGVSARQWLDGTVYGVDLSVDDLTGVTTLCFSANDKIRAHR